MAYTLEQFAAECREALMTDPGPAGREKVRKLVARACTDADFVRTHLGPENESPRTVLYEDPDLGFCILAHVYVGPKGSDPHDHGPSWAIYGQADGVTEMTDWRLVSPPENGAPGKVVRVRTYTLEPGDAHVYQEGELHSPKRDHTTRLIRVEGTNMDNVEREKYEAVA